MRFIPPLAMAAVVLLQLTKHADAQADQGREPQ